MHEPKDPTFEQLQVLTDAVRKYYESASAILPTKKNLEDWLAMFPEEEQAELALLGMSYCWSLPPFRRFVYEGQGHRLDEFLRDRLGPDEYATWLNL